jgi:hypothetical protein
MGLLVGGLGHGCARDPVRTIQQLAGLEDHLHDVLVAVKASRFGRVEGEEEDIHGGKCPLACDS